MNCLLIIAVRILIDSIWSRHFTLLTGRRSNFVKKIVEHLYLLLILLLKWRKRKYLFFDREKINAIPVLNLKMETSLKMTTQNKKIQKALARNQKEEDKKLAVEGKIHAVTMDVQAVKLSPFLLASALYYKTKLCCHNFMVYNLANTHVTCFWFDETNADRQANTYASFLVDYLEEHFLKDTTNKMPIVIFL